MEKLEKALKDLEKKNKAIEKAIRDIQDKIKEERPEYKAGDWVTDGKYTICITIIDETNFWGYGFSSYNGWVDYSTEGSNSRGWSTTKDIKRLCTNEEVQTALISEAKRRGFKEGVRFDCENSDAKNCLFSDFYNGDKLKWQFSPENNTLSKECNQFFFKEGKWAEIIENKLTINGDVVNIKGDTMTIGCKSMTTQMFIDFVGDLDFFDIHTIYGDKDKGYNIEDLKKICDELK